MDFVARPLLLAAVGAVAEATFWDGFGRALAQANIPHTPDQLGATVAVAVGILASQVWQWWQSRQRVHVMVGQALAAHLAAYRADSPPEDEAAPAAPAAPSTPVQNAVQSPISSLDGNNATS